MDHIPWTNSGVISIELNKARDSNFYSHGPSRHRYSSYWHQIFVASVWCCSPKYEQNRSYRFMVASTTFLEERRGGQSGSLQVACDRMACRAVRMLPSSPWRQEGGREIPGMWILPKKLQVVGKKLAQGRAYKSCNQEGCTSGPGCLHWHWPITAINLTHCH